jgi:A/G-specific adenine glycosylase
VQGALTGWGERTRRDLPWRRTRDPWAVLVSELMLQQTQVARVIPKYEAFLARFPSVEGCAAAPLAEVVRLWAGLGYNRRAVNLHRCAVIVVDRHGGRLPSDLHELLALPGIGPYTARAVAAFAFEHDVGILDTNAARVLARVGGRALNRADAQELADALVPEGGGWAWNQAMLDLGATVCTSRAPRCAECPVAASCGWHARGCTGVDPAIGSAGVSTRQSVFEGSDRQGRGRLVDALRTDGSIERHDLADRAGWHEDAPRAMRAAESLVRDGLARWDGTRLALA